MGQTSIFRLAFLTVFSCLLTLSQFPFLYRHDLVEFRSCFVPLKKIFLLHHGVRVKWVKVSIKGRSAFSWAGQYWSNSDRSSDKTNGICKNQKRVLVSVFYQRGFWRYFPLIQTERRRMVDMKLYRLQLVLKHICEKFVTVLCCIITNCVAGAQTFVCLMMVQKCVYIWRTHKQRAGLLNATEGDSFPNDENESFLDNKGIQTLILLSCVRVFTCATVTSLFVCGICKSR